MLTLGVIVSVDISVGIIRFNRDVSVAIDMKLPLVDFKYHYLKQRLRKPIRKQDVDF